MFQGMETRFTMNFKKKIGYISNRFIVNQVFDEYADFDPNWNPNCQMLYIYIDCTAIGFR